MKIRFCSTTSSLFLSSGKNKSEYQNHVQTIKQKVNGLINANNTVEAAAFINQYSLELKESFEFTRTLFISREPYLLDIFALSRQATFYPLLIKTYKLDNSDTKDNFKRIAQLVEIICFPPQYYRIQSRQRT